MCFSLFLCQLQEGTRQYQIKWLNYPPEANTWEKGKNLQCPDILAAYLEVLGPAFEEPTAELVGGQVQEVISLLERKSKSRKQATALKKWEKELNARRGNEAVICVENHVDLAGPPSDFTYISECVAADGVTILKDPLVGCTCTARSAEGCSASSECCASHAGGAFAYKERRLVLDAGQGIFECNSRCMCMSKRSLSRDICPNRVVQLGRQVGEMSVTLWPLFVAVFA